MASRPVGCPIAATRAFSPAGPCRPGQLVLVYDRGARTAGRDQRASPSQPGGPAVTAAAPTIQAFFLTRLGSELDASPHTIDSYRHAFRLLLAYAKTQTGKDPADLDLSDLDAILVSGFLDHLEVDRHNSIASRNTRLAAIHSFFGFASYRHPEHAQTIRQVLAIPQKKTKTVPRSFLTETEMDAVICAPDRSTWSGRR